ncbi:hypothetical protein [Bradyrhizobium sp. LA2.1]|uniref:hypothetical protein n=1 Tax=Bradyrhizobium sp. LA2.1 TaxID=3156376 RepID=UPI003393D8D5
MGFSMRRTITDQTRDEHRELISTSSDDVATTLDGQWHGIGVSYRPGACLPLATLVTTVDNGPTPQPANNNRPVRQHLKEMAQRGELGVNEPENRRHAFAAERLKRDIAVSRGEPLNDSAANDWRELRGDYFGEGIDSLGSDNEILLSDELEFEDTDAPEQSAVVDNAGTECAQVCIHRVQQVVALAKEVLGDDYGVLESVIVNNWTAQAVGENELFGHRATASACGKGMIRSALRNLARFYDRLDRLELSGDRPIDVWPLIGTQYPTVKYPREFRLKASYMNQSRNYVVRHPASDGAAA